MPTVAAAIERGLCPASWRGAGHRGDTAAFALPDFEKLPLDGDITFENKPRLVRAFLRRGFGTGPQVDRAKCVGCGKCREVCPAGAAQVKGNKARIDRSKLHPLLLLPGVLPTRRDHLPPPGDSEDSLQIIRSNAPGLSRGRFAPFPPLP